MLPLFGRHARLVVSMNSLFATTVTKTAGDGPYATRSAHYRWLRLLFVLCALLTTSAFADNQNKPKVIGVLMSGTAKATMPYIDAFIQGMRELGWSDDKTVKYTMRFDEDDKSRLPGLAAELVALHVDVLASTSVATPAARAATTTIPIVAMDTYDPVEEGLTPSLSTPVGNVTGASGQSGESAAKRVELARDLVPHLQRIALITDPGDIGATIDAKSSRAAAARLGLDLRAFEVHRARDYPAAFAVIKRYRPEVLMVTASTLTIDNLTQTASFASNNRLPAFSEYSSFAEAGFLLPTAWATSISLSWLPYRLTRFLRARSRRICLGSNPLTSSKW